MIVSLMIAKKRKEMYENGKREKRIVNVRKNPFELN